MPDPSPFAVVIVLLVLGGCAWLAFLPLWMYNRVKGIERALWAVVTQLQQMREGPISNDPVQQLLRQRQPPGADGEIANSMFGR